MKNKEELSMLKKEVENLNEKLSELSEEELKMVVGGGAEKVKFGCVDNTQEIGGLKEAERILKPQS